MPIDSNASPEVVPPCSLGTDRDRAGSVTTWAAGHGLSRSFSSVLEVRWWWPGAEPVASAVVIVKSSGSQIRHDAGNPLGGTVASRVSKVLSGFAAVVLTGGTSAASASPGPVTATTSTAYVVNQTSNTVTPISTASNTAGTAIAVGQLPDAIAIT